MIKRTNSSADLQYDKIFDDRDIGASARQVMAASQLSGFTIKSMYMDDKYSAQLGESFAEWANACWKETPPRLPDQTTIERAMEVFATTISPEGTIPLADFIIFEQLEGVAYSGANAPLEQVQISIQRP